jgi:L-alanine-DL-glutamate epimerase-like enolase superfamily enzyme
VSNAANIRPTSGRSERIEPVLPGSARLRFHRLIAEPLKLENGIAVAPSQHGHGINFDWQRLSALRT